jgi:hypothetical protein
MGTSLTPHQPLERRRHRLEAGTLPLERETLWDIEAKQEIQARVQVAYAAAQRRAVRA